MAKIGKVQENLKQVDKKVCEMENLLNEIRPKESRRMSNEILGAIKELSDWQIKLHRLVKDPAMEEEKEKKGGEQDANG